MTQSILLDNNTWDLTTNAKGHIAVAASDYSLAQKAANEIRLVKGEYYYDTTQGIPYFDSVLGKRPTIAWLRAKFISAALGVDGVASAACYFSSFGDRSLSGQIQVSDSSGKLSVASF